MGAKLLYDVMTTVKLGQEEWQENKALCIYCQAATVATVASAMLAIPEVMHAIDNLRGQGESPARSQPQAQQPWHPTFNQEPTTTPPTAVYA